MQRRDQIHAQFRCVSRIEYSAARAIEPHQPFIRSNPQVAVTRLEHRAHQSRRETFVRPPMTDRDRVVRKRRAKAQRRRHRQGKENPGQETNCAKWHAGMRWHLSTRRSEAPNGIVSILTRLRRRNEACFYELNPANTGRPLAHTPLLDGIIVRRIDRGTKPVEAPRKWTRRQSCIRRRHRRRFRHDRPRHKTTRGRAGCGKP